MYKTTNGLVLRETNYKEADKILTVLTESEGKITVSAKGARRKGSRIAASAQLLVLSEMTLFNYNGRWSLNEANTKEIFNGIRSDIALISLGSYFAELLEAVTDEDQPDPQILSLGLNTLYALSAGLKPKEIIKAAFEIRLMCLAGFEPALEACDGCGEDELSDLRLDLRGGVIYCPSCGKDAGESLQLCLSSLNALRYITGAEPKKLFSFTIDGEALKRLSSVAEAYVMTHMERKFATLDFYKSLN